MSTAKPAANGRMLWYALWLSFFALVALEVLDAWQRSVPMLLWILWLLPLGILLPGLLRGRLRTVTWLAFVSLLYFVLAVLRLFAEPESTRAQLELVAVIGLFTCSMFYVRVRGRELLANAEVIGDVPTIDDEFKSEV